MNPFDTLGQRGDLDPLQGSLAAEREHALQADRAAQMLVGCLLLALFSGACIAGWLL